MSAPGDPLPGRASSINTIFFKHYSSVFQISGTVDFRHFLKSSYVTKALV